MWLGYTLIIAVIGLSRASLVHSADGAIDPSFDMGSVLVEDSTLGSALAVDASYRINSPTLRLAQLD